MNNFEFYNPVKILFGKDQIAKISEELKPYKKIMLTYGKGSIKTNGIYEQVIKALNGYDFIEFGGIEANPTYDTLIKAVHIAKQEKVDFILAVGGGSVIDGTKFIAAAIKYKNGDPWNILSKYDKFDDAVKLGAILTLPATGSEMNGNAVITRLSTNEKLAFGSPLLLPQFSVLDPQTMYSLPDIQISNGIVDAFVHIIEQYLTYPVNAAVQDGFAESLLRILIEHGPQVLANRTDYDANANLMWTATMALNGLLSTGVPTDWSTHMIGHELTALYGIDHAQTLAIVLPGVMQVMREQKSEKLLQYANNVWGIFGDDNNEVIDVAINETEQFFNSVGIKTKLHDYDLDDSVITIICERLKNRNFVKLGEKKNINPEKVEEILRLVI
jgi:NADP-dependent alcohol dehydrogenase